MSKKFNWGILGTGNIASQFATGLKAVANAEIYAVGSRSQKSADAFGEKVGAKKKYGSYEELANDADIDIIYIATPNTSHYEHATLCIKAGKNVLCEKPLTLNAKAAKKLAKLAKENNVFFMEAIWSRFLPVYKKLKEWFDTGVIGDVHVLKADLAFKAPFPPHDRHVNLDLAGGALLDVGVYLISFAQFVFGGLPTNIISKSSIGPTGVDVDDTIILDYGKGKTAMLYTSFNVMMPHDALICGSKGRIYINNFWRPTSAELTVYNPVNPFAPGTTEKIDLPFIANGYEYEAMAVMDSIEQGKKTCDLMSIDQTLDVMKTMDKIRENMGLVYPMEDK